MDFHKQKAKHDLWNNNGGCTVKQFRYKGGAREAEKQLIRKELQDLQDDEDREIWHAMYEEVEESMYCHEYGPCDRCLARSQLESKITIDISK